MSADPREAKLQAALAAVIASGGGVKGHAQAHGVPVTTLRRRWEAHRGNRGPVKRDHAPAKATRAPLRPPAPRTAAPPEIDDQDEDDGFDPVTATVVERLEHQLRRAWRMVDRLNREGNRTVARQWEITAADVGQQLDAARAEGVAEERRRQAAEVRDPVLMSEQVLVELPVLLRLLEPERARELVRAAMEIVGIVEA